LRYGCNYKTPKDLGWYMMNFNFNPGEYQQVGISIVLGLENYILNTLATLMQAITILLA